MGWTPAVGVAVFIRQKTAEKIVKIKTVVNKKKTTTQITQADDSVNY